MEVKEARELDGWRELHQACAQIDVYFDNYVKVRGRMSVRVFTTKPNRFLPRVVDLVYLCRGEGHDPVSASIDGLRKSGGSSLQAWLTALRVQVAQLRVMLDE